MDSMGYTKSSRLIDLATMTFSGNFAPIIYSFANALGYKLWSLPFYTQPLGFVCSATHTDLYSNIPLLRFNIIAVTRMVPIAIPMVNGYPAVSRNP